MNQPVETIEQFNAETEAQQAASMNREPVLFEGDDDEDDDLTLIDREH